MRWAFLLLLLAACSKGDAAAEMPASVCRQQLFEGSRFTVCDPGKGELRLVAAARNEKPIRSFAELAARIDPGKVAFAMNAGMYDEAGRPIGLAIAEGRQKRAINRRKGGGNFHLMPNGVFQVHGDGRAEVVASGSWTPSPTIRLATQSGPMLVIEGKLHPKFAPDGSSRHIRNGVGARGGKALFVISQDPVSLGRFARFFRDGLCTPNALFFDGAVSSLWDPASGREDSHSPLGPIVVAFKPR
ncbi:MAG TPA: phosphodiester glycosidase family protein [Sphingomicrobium sp.]|nr:phosphodiester glycosidase family protein [Sphingomicrobium sp.]